MATKKKYPKTKSMRHLTVQPRLTIYANGDENGSALGKGVATLLAGIRDLGSLNAAAKGIHMAYSKAWKITKEAEAAFGFTFFDRDGARGSELTPEGAKLLWAYEVMEAEAIETLERRFRELSATTTVPEFIEADEEE